METLTPLINLLRDGGAIAAMVLIGFSVHKEFLVLGREYRECVKQRDTYKALLDRHAEKLESRLDKYEAEREVSRVTSPS